MIRFLLNRTPVSLDLVLPDLTVLDYLRDDCHKCGTKEGCASGDCGACTVVIASVEAGKLSYQSVNACITFLGALHGKQLIVVEDLEDNSVLHPVQQALFDLHGSQCGFCTPGFIMSMFALYKNITAGKQIVPADGNWLPVIESCLGGNLCRCTGYRPIVDACLQVILSLTVHTKQERDQFDRHEAQACAELESIGDPVKESNFHLPRTLNELDSLLQTHPDARLVAGGTDLALEVTQQLRRIPTLICLQQLPALDTFDISADVCTIGAGVSLTRCTNELGALLPDLHRLLHRFASMQVRNQGTVGGNIANASPVGDLPPILLALDATLQLRSAKGTRVLPLVDFFTAYKITALQAGEYIQSIRIDDIGLLLARSPRARLKIYKISKRLDDDISAVCGVFNITLDANRITAARVAFGGMAATPRRASMLEAALVGQSMSPVLLEAGKCALLADFEPIGDARASAAYRRQVAGNLLDRLFLELSPDTPKGTLTQVADYA